VPFTKAQGTKPSAITMTFCVIIPARIRKTDATNERFSERINRERLSVSTALPVRPGTLRSSLSLPDAQKVEPSTRGYLRDRLLYWYNPRGAYPGFLCLYVVISLSLSLCLSLFLALSVDSLPSVEEHTNIYTWTSVSPTEIFFSTVCSCIWSRISGDATEKGED